jgi:hypothetical protein
MAGGFLLFVFLLETLGRNGLIALLAALFFVGFFGAAAIKWWSEKRKNQKPN